MSFNNIRRELQQFGNNTHLLAVFMIMSVPLPFLIVGILILMAKILRNIKNVNFVKYNDNLFAFYYKYKYSAILRSTGLIFTAGSATIFAFALLGRIPFNPWFVLIVLIGSITLLFGGSLSEVKAWEELRIYFEEHNDLLSKQMYRNIIEGCIELRKGAVIYFLWFLIIPILIGYIFQVKGFFKLSILKNMGITR